jgi:retron-type reverse transcriptase
MKRTGQLWERILDRDNLRLATAKAVKGKRQREDARGWCAELEANLARMAAELRGGTFAVGRFHQFVIYDPKERIITAPCFAERVLHHAIMNVCEPYLDRWLIHDTYACRTGKGRIAALARARQFARRHRFFLKMDIAKYFDSVSHDRLLRLWQRRFKDARLAELVERIVRSYRGAGGCGLPIGALTSQHLANFYLGWLDRYCQETLRIPGYVRYMDDIVLWADDSRWLGQAQRALERFLADDLVLRLKERPYRNRTALGMDFLGCRVFASHMVLNRRSRVRFARKLKDLEYARQLGTWSDAELQCRGRALVAFTQTPGLLAWRFRAKTLGRLWVSGHEARSA